MYRILIVEDDPETVKVLSRLIRLEFPAGLPDECEPQIDAAATVAGAKELIGGAPKPYHAVILDFKLPPQRVGDNPEIDETLCIRVRRAMPSALVAHITSYPDDRILQDHIRRLHTERINANALALSKLENNWTEKLLAELKQFLYGRPIAERLDRIFGEEFAERPAATSLAAGRERGQRSLTHDLAELGCAIVEHWDDLDEQLQSRVERLFKVDSTQKPIKISLL